MELPSSVFRHGGTRTIARIHSRRGWLPLRGGPVESEGYVPGRWASAAGHLARSGLGVFPLAPASPVG
jgi:hypothetical protein